MSMIIKNNPESYEDKDAILFVFQRDKLLMKKTADGYKIPDISDKDLQDIISKYRLYLGSLNGRSCYASRCIEELLPMDDSEFLGLRQIFDRISIEEFQMAGRAIQMLRWDETHKFCGSCGERTEKKSDENAKICTNCGHISYPRLSPAIIVAITKGDKLLLAKNRNSAYGFHSVLAGFVEAGESLEECVIREIREEVGIEVQNIRYFGSQPWPFPNSLMLGFTAEYKSGEINIDTNELSHANWYSLCDFPSIPSSISISRKLIDWFIEKNK